MMFYCSNIEVTNTYAFLFNLSFIISEPRNGNTSIIMHNEVGLFYLSILCNSEAICKHLHKCLNIALYVANICTQNSRGKM